MIWCRAIGGTERKNAKVAAAPARNTTNIGVPSASSATGKTASDQIMRSPAAPGAREQLGDITREQQRGHDRRAAEADHQGEMRNGHGKAERHAGLPDRGNLADKGPALDGRDMRSATTMALCWMTESAERERGPSRLARKSSAILRRLAVTRISPSITSQIIMNTSTSSAPVNTIPNR